VEPCFLCRPGHISFRVRVIDITAQWLEFVGVAVIGIAFIYAAFRALGHFRQRRPDPYTLLKVFIGKALQLGLEFLVAADIIRTVTVDSNHREDNFPCIANCRANIFELVNCSRNRRLLALAGRKK
jgi:uncharacterized membrane protein